MYVEKTCTNQNHSKKYICQHSDQSNGLKVVIDKGRQFIIVLIALGLSLNKMDIPSKKLKTLSHQNEQGFIQSNCFIY